MILTLAAAALACTVHDGDSINCNRERIRLVGIDAPETRGSPKCRRQQNGWCDHALAERSRVALARFMQRGTVRVIRCGEDRYGRTLASVTVNGQDAGAYLLRNGLARRYTGRTGCTKPL